MEDKAFALMAKFLFIIWLLYKHTDSASTAKTLGGVFETRCPNARQCVSLNESGHVTVNDIDELWSKYTIF